VRNSVLNVIGSNQFSAFISTDPSQFKMEAMESNMLANAEAAVQTNNYGIELRYLGIKKLELPESSTQEVFKQMSSERAILVSKIQRDGDTVAANIRTEANSESARLVADADAEAKRIRGEAEAEVAQYFKVFEQNPVWPTSSSNLTPSKRPLGQECHPGF